MWGLTFKCSVSFWTRWFQHDFLLQPGAAHSTKDPSSRRTHKPTEKTQDPAPRNVCAPCAAPVCTHCVHSQVCACTEYVIAYMFCVRRQCARRLKLLRAVYANTPAQHTSCRLTGREIRLPDSREHLKLLKCRQLHILVIALLQIAATLRRSTLASLAEGGTKMLAESGPSLWFQGPPYLPASALQIKFNRYRMWHHQWITLWVFSLIINVFMWKRRSLQYVTNQEHGQVYREQSIVII